MQLSEQELVRRASKEKLEEIGINPYPSETFEINSNTKIIKEEFERLRKEKKEIQLAGRMMSRRIMGSASFAEIQDNKGKVQVYFRRDDICPEEDKTLYNTVFKKLLDIGDIIGVCGELFKTQTNEISIYVKSFKLLSKSLKPLPIVKETENIGGKAIKHDAFTDTELRYRQRYVDLIVNPHIKKTFEKRTLLVNTIRNFLNEKSYLEVETPILQPLYGGAAAKPFTTHHNKLDMKLYLRIANELYLKRLIVGGFDGVYEFAKDFRNEGMSRFHNPEFTQVELYVAYKDYHWMMNLVEEMIEKVAIAINGSTQITVGNNVLDFKRPWKRFTMFEVIQHFTGINISGMDEDELRQTAKKLNVSVDNTMGKGKLIDEIFGEKCEKNLIQPTFITDYPVEMSPLAKKHPNNKDLAERFEAIVNGKEICNAFSELNDPIDQRERMQEQLDLGKRGDEEAMTLDEDFLRAVSYGMPPTAGLGVGIDRLTMIMTNSESIQDVLFFPQMKPEKGENLPLKDEFDRLEIRKDLLPIIKKIGFNSVQQLKEANPNKLFNDICGMRKKMKLEVKNPTLDEVKEWLNHS